MRCQPKKRILQTVRTHGAAFRGAYLISLIFIGLLLVATSSHAQTSTLWIRQVSTLRPYLVQADLDFPTEHSGTEPVPLRLHVTSLGVYHDAQGRVEVRNEAGAVRQNFSFPLNIPNGKQTFDIQWDTAPLEPGRYTVTLRIDYRENREPAGVDLVVWKIVPEALHQAILGVQNHLSDLQQRCEQDSAFRAALSAPLTLLKQTMNNAAEAFENQRYRAAAEALEYTSERVRQVEAAIAFAALRPELNQSTPPPTTSPQPDGPIFTAGAVPTFLFGLTAESPNTAVLERAHELGLNFVTVLLPPSETLSPTAPPTLPDAYAAFFSRARELGIAVAVRLVPHLLPAWLWDAAPQWAQGAALDLSDEAATRYAIQHIQRAALWLKDQPGIVTVVLADHPYLAFQTEAVRRDFIKAIQARYPDRQELNRMWHAHLGTFDEIVIWGDFPEYAYQNSRSFQYDWQTYHREQVFAWLAKIRSAFRDAGNTLPISFAFANSAFELRESREGIPRERLHELIDVNGAATPTPHLQTSDMYALDYPQPYAYYALMNANAGGKPLVNFGLDLIPAPEANASDRFRFARTAVWQSVMTGLDAASLAPSSGALQDVALLDGFITAAQDINRLADLVAAFQKAPGDVCILFSDASKIFDEGDPHLRSAQYAYEGSTFSGFHVTFITETQINEGILDHCPVLVIPATPSLPTDAFQRVENYIARGGAVARVGTPIPYDERGNSRYDVLPPSGATVLVRGMNLPTEYLHAMDALTVQESLPKIYRAVNRSGYPLEGVFTRYLQKDGEHYLYLVNLRKDRVNVHLTGNVASGRDLIAGKDVSFPRLVEPLQPMLIRLDKPNATSITLAEQPPAP